MSTASNNLAITLPAPGPGEPTAVRPARRDDELLDYRRGMRRLFVLGVTVWPFFLLVDLLGRSADRVRGQILWLIGWRVVGFVAGLMGLQLMRRDLSRRSLQFLEAGIFALGGVLLTLISIPFGGLASRWLQGIVILLFARSAVLPSHWRQAITMSLLCALMAPVTMVVAALFMPALRAQWSHGSDVLVFVHNEVFVVSGALVGGISCHIAWSLRRELHALRRLGSFRLKAMIGSGGVGDVWLAWQDPPGREVALKVLKEIACRDPAAVRRFEREAEAASQLEHPNTIRILDYGASDEGVPYIAMELLYGLDVDMIVTRHGPMPASRAIHLARQACGSLAEAHAKGIVHRDLKPANLFVTNDDEGTDELKVLDFGLARTIQNAATSLPSPVTPEGVICGTPAFMAPEASASEGVDARADIYSLGAVLYFMLTGTVVFPHLTITESVMAHVGRIPEPPSKRVADIPADVERVVLKCLAKAPQDRYESATALATALAQCKDAGKWTAADARAFWEGATGPRSLTRLKS